MNQILKLDSPVRFLRGVGPERSRLLEELGVQTLSDLLFFFPRRYENRAPIKKIADIEGGEEKECVAGRVISCKSIRTKSGRMMFRIVVKDATAVGVARRAAPALFATWFNIPFLSKSIQTGTRLILWGKAERSGAAFHMAHPEFEVADAGNSFHFGRIVPIYPLVEELSQKVVRQLTWAGVEEFSARLGERLPEDRRRALGLMPLGQALCAMHFPDSFETLKNARARLVFDEFLTLQLAVGMRRLAQRIHRPELSHPSRVDVIAEFMGSLDFELTAGQKRAIDTILIDLGRPYPMNRILQADVGCGKTVVAAAAILHTVSSGFQAAFMAPTEVLARQQMFALSRHLEPHGVKLAYVGQAQEDAVWVLKQIAAGEVQVAVGTHALLEKKVKFKNLGLAVVDEQHKFGVGQRAALRDSSGKSAHFLMLTATPIPQSLAMTLYGDLDISEIREQPKGRQPIRTAYVDSSRRQEVYDFLEKTVTEKGRAFVVCPLLSKGAAGSKNALGVTRELQERFPKLAVACLHGRLKSPEKEKLVRDFRAGRIKVLVCTVVIEVGIDVPDAHLMIIEDAERFGMAQLHQLRGRVGRGSEESFCFLVSNSQDSEVQERLQVFCRISSGFELAQKDLESRGQGELVGRRQHGRSELVLGDFMRDELLLRMARDEAVRILSADATLSNNEHRFLRKMVAGRHKGALTGAAV